MKLQMNAEARRRALLVDGWWRENRPAAPSLFSVELTHAFELLVSSPRLGVVYQQLGKRLVYRYLLPKTQQHLYYWVDDERDTLRVLTIWGAARGRPPGLR
jgi:plasmid stabilization system protein ParE